MSKNACKICGNVHYNKTYIVKERQLNTGDTFHYMYCKKCGTLQLTDDVDPSPYYSNNYYSFHLQADKQPGTIKRILTKIIVKDIFIPEWLMYILRKMLGFSTMILYATEINRNSVIIDVGGGNGAYAKELKNLGYNNIMCLDKYCDSTMYEGVDFLQGELSDVNGKQQYDLMIFNHSFEHMNNPIDILTQVEYLLKDDGICLIRIPICENHVWNQYKEYWRNIDAPRHYFLYTPRSLSYLCKKAGLKIKKIRWDSYAGQMQVAENYYREDQGKKPIEIINDTLSKKIRFWHKTNVINKSRIGDQACFYIIKASNK